MNAKIISITKQKGGVGKTTTCANLGIGLAMEGKKVLLVDATLKVVCPLVWDTHSQI